MKKILIGIISLLAIFTLSGCGETTYTEPNWDEDLTEFELIQYVKDELEIENSDNIMENLVIQRSIRLGTRTVIIEWQAIGHSSINDRGVVIRPLEDEADLEVQYRANISVENGASSDIKDFFLTIKKIPSTTEGKLEEAELMLELIEDNFIQRDQIVLDRVGAHASYITWETSDDSIVDTNGYVYKTDKNQDVTLTATIELDDESVEKEFKATVESTTEESEEFITTDSKGITEIITVTSSDELRRAMVTAEPGHAIVMADGIYRNVVFDMTKSGTEENPIYIMAENPGRAIFSDETQINVYANNVILSGLDFRNGYPSTDVGAIRLEGENLRLTNTRISEFEKINEDYKWVSVNGKYIEIDRNEFSNKTVGGALLTIWRDDNTAQYHHIHNNYFADFKDAGGANGYETIRIGDSHQSQSDAYIMLENNLFERLDGEIEIVSVKSGKNILRNNTILDSAGMLVTRHGKNNVFEGNVFDGTDTVGDTGEPKAHSGGFRAYDGGHVFRNNYIENTYTSSETRAGIVIHSGINEPGTSTTMNAQWTSFNMLIEGNTFVDARQSIHVDGKYAIPARDIILKDNYIYAKAGYSAMRHNAEMINYTFINNEMFSDTAFSAGGTVFPTAPTGIEYTTVSTVSLPERNENGLMLVDGIGASNLTKLTIQDVRPNWI